MRALVAIALCIGVTAAHAQPGSQAAQGAKLFEEGRALVKEGKYAEACQKFAESYQLDRAAGTQLNLGDCAEREGKLRKAWLLFDDAARAYEKTGRAAAAKLARDRAVALEPKLATVIVKIAEPGLPGLVVRIGDHGAVPAAQIVEHLEPGEVAITASAPGRTAFATSVTGEVGKQVTVEIPLLAGGSAGAPGPGVVAPRPETPPQGPRDRSRVRLAFGLGIGGGAAFVVSGILGLSARGTYQAAERDHCTRTGGQLACDDEGLSAIDSAGTRANIATAVAIGGGALVAAGAILYFTAPREQIQVAPMASETTLGLAVGTRF
ncbi:MAG TPA: hypothetical protein VIU61_18770 [Kofleriaceae bacterium]